MKTTIKLSFLPYLILIILSITACSKDENTEEPVKTNTEKIIGTWQLTDGDYKGTITFEKESRLAYDYFTHDANVGVSIYGWQLSDNQLSMTLIMSKGDYSDYNEISVGTVRNYVVEVTDNELTINYNGVPYVYTRLASDSIISETEIEGSWQLENNDYRGVITFNINSGYASNLGTKAFMSAADSGAANFEWKINGNVIFLSNAMNYGGFEGEKLSVSKISIADNEITFSVNDESYTYTRISEDNVLSKNDLIGSWKLTDGTLTEIVSFNLNQPYSDGNSRHSFIDGASSGISIYNYWTVSVDIFAIRYQGGLFDDYSSYFGINGNDFISTRISSSNNQLTFHTPDGDYIYSRMDDNEIITNSEIVGTWEMTDGGYTSEIIFNDNETGSDSFTDGAQSGTAEFACVFNGNMLKLGYNSMTGDYESYNQISPDKKTYTLLSLTGNLLTFTSDGIDYVYTKKTN